MITPQEEELLRTYPHEVKARLSIYQPGIALACQVNNASITKGARVIAFDTVSGGDWEDVREGMTMLVGSQAGLSDYGKIRVRSATSSELSVAENSDIQWADELHLTVLKFFDVVPVFPRIIPDPSDAEKQIFYKDYDIPYTDQNLVNGTFICMGSHREAELVGGQAVLMYSATGTYNVNQESIEFWWDFEGSTSTGSSVMEPGPVTYETPGHYLTTLTVTSSSGAVDVSHRYIIINQPGTTIESWSLSSMQGSRASGGYIANVGISQPLGFELSPGAVVIISMKEYYGDVQQNIGGRAGQRDIFFVGYIIQNTITYGYNKSSVSFQIGSVTELMKLANGFAITLEDVSGTPAYWYQLQNLNFIKAAYHFWRWHSTVLKTVDVECLLPEIPQQFFDSNKESLYDAVASSLGSTLVGELVSDRLSKLWLEIAVRATPDALTAFPPEMVLDDSTWMGEPTVQELRETPRAYLELGGIVYLGPGEENSVPLLACAPGETPMVRGKSSPETGLALLSQEQLNALVGDVFWSENAQYPTVSMNMRGSYTNMDIAPQTAYTVRVTR